MDVLLLTHDEEIYPHEGGCKECRNQNRCNYCGTNVVETIFSPCANGRCTKCHMLICAEGHGYWREGKLPSKFQRMFMKK